LGRGEKTVVKTMLKKSALSLNIETLRELTPDEAAGVNGGMKVSSAMPPVGPQTGFVQPTSTAVSSVLAPTHHKKKHHHV
jgi:hypothetical protein